jgi:hypothetical protein
MATKKIKLDRQAISEILVTDTDLESGAEASDVEEEFFGSEEEEYEQLQDSAQEDKPQAATSGGELPTWGLPQGRNNYIHPFVGPAKGVKNSEAPHINKDSFPLSVLMIFFTQIFQLLLEQIYTTSNT